MLIHPRFDDDGPFFLWSAVVRNILEHGLMSSVPWQKTAVGSFIPDFHHMSFAAAAGSSVQCTVIINISSAVYLTRLFFLKGVLQIKHINGFGSAG